MKTKRSLIGKIAGSLVGLAMAGSVLGGNPKKIPQEDLLEYARYTGDFEGRREWVYDDATGKRLYPGENPRGNRTIGVGHCLERKDSQQTFAKVLPEVNYKLIYNGEQKLTTPQIDKSFSQDLREYVQYAKHYFPEFNSYPLYLQKALVDGFFRGELFKSPRTRNLINAGKFLDAAVEYTENKEYMNSINNKMAGVANRMQKNRAAMIKYALSKRYKK
jgi:hypothetical protein